MDNQFDQHAFDCFMLHRYDSYLLKRIEGKGNWTASLRLHSSFDAAEQKEAVQFVHGFLTHKGISLPAEIFKADAHSVSFEISPELQPKVLGLFARLEIEYCPTTKRTRGFGRTGRAKTAAKPT
jgi:hypothetical protein